MIVQIDVVPETDDHTVLSYHPPRTQVMLYTLHDRTTWDGATEVERWLLALDGRVFYKHVPLFGISERASRQ